MNWPVLRVLPLRDEVGGTNDNVVFGLHHHGHLATTGRLQDPDQQLQVVLEGFSSNYKKSLKNS